MKRKLQQLRQYWERDRYRKRIGTENTDERLRLICVRRGDMTRRGETYRRERGKYFKKREKDISSRGRRLKAPEMSKHGIWRTIVWTEHSLITELLRDEVCRGHRGPNIYFLLRAFDFIVWTMNNQWHLWEAKEDRYIIKLICYVINHKVLCLWPRVLVSSVNIHETTATNWLACKSSKISDPVFDRGWGFHF